MYCFKGLLIRNTLSITKIFPACVQAYRSFCHSWSLTRLCDALHIHSLSNYEEKGVGFNICKNIKMTLYSEIKPIGYGETC